MAKDKDYYWSGGDDAPRMVPFSVFFPGYTKRRYSSGSWQEKFERRQAQERQFAKQKAKRKRRKLK